MSVFKASLLDRTQYVSTQIAKEFAWQNVQNSIHMLIPSDIFNEWQNLLSTDQKKYWSEKIIEPSDICSLISAEKASNHPLIDYFRKQKIFLERHMHETIREHKQALLVDTGWSGSIVDSLQTAFPDISMMAHFFGRYNYGAPPLPWFPQVIGIELEADGYDFRHPVTSIFLHRHLIEGVCEVRWRSVEGYSLNNELQLVEPEGGFMPESARRPNHQEPLAAGVERYLCECKSGLRAARIHQNAHQAALKLRRLICYPKPKEVRSITVSHRSADFGKELDVPVLSEPAPLNKLRQKFNQIHHGLWPQGQIALEFPRLHPLMQYLYLNRKQLGLLRTVLTKLISKLH
jgi:hypothetical protein